jgi:hypothetical protein
MIEWPANATRGRLADFFVNNTYIAGEMAGGYALNATDGPFNVGTTLVKLAVNDYVEVRVYQVSGIALSVVAGGASDQNHNDFWMAFRGPA